MTTFVAEVQTVAADDVAALRRRLVDRLDAVGEAVGVLESWTDRSDETRTELASKYETAKSLARDEIRSADGPGTNGAGEIAPEDLLTHPAVSDATKRRLSEYGTKLHAFLDEERSYESAREELRRALDAELSLYRTLLADLDSDTSVRDAQQALARFARESTPGPASKTATDLLLDAAAAETESSEE